MLKLTRMTLLVCFVFAGSVSAVKAPPPNFAMRVSVFLVTGSLSNPIFTPSPGANLNTRLVLLTQPRRTIEIPMTTNQQGEVLVGYRLDPTLLPIGAGYEILGEFISEEGVRYVGRATGEVRITNNGSMPLSVYMRAL